MIFHCSFDIPALSISEKSGWVPTAAIVFHLRQDAF
jgi:hypothetical protein